MADVIHIFTVQHNGKDAGSHAIFEDDFDPTFSTKEGRSYAHSERRPDGSYVATIKENDGQVTYYCGDYGIKF